MNPGILTFLAPLVAGGISVTVMLLMVRSRGLPFDKPNERSLHTVAVPRTGGIAVMAGILASALMLFVPIVIVGPVVGLAVLSYVDDRYRLSVSLRLVGHLLAAAAFVWASGLFASLPIALALVLALAWLTNLYNFMDGSDGLAGGMTIIGFSFYAVAAWLSGIPGLALLSFSIAAAAAGFLIFNFPPARIFMGDVGSIPLGFLAGAVGLAGWEQAAWPLWFPILIFAPFIVDASATLLRRILHGKQIWQAHRQHYYQRLIRLGWSHRKTALAEYALMVMCGVAALTWLETSQLTRSVVFCLMLTIFAVAMCAVDNRWRQLSSTGHD